MSKAATAGESGVRHVLAVIKTTLVGGLVVLAPLVVLALLASKLGELVRRLARPLARWISLDSPRGLLVATIVVAVLLLALCFLAGLLARVGFTSRFLKRAEAGVLWRIPGYGFVKGLTDSLDHHHAASMRPVLIHFDDCAQIAFEVDRLPDGRRVVYVPSAPDPKAGSVMVMDAQRVEPLSMSFVATVAHLRQLGHGLGARLTPPG